MNRILPNQRLDYSAISDRPARSLPDGKRLAVWVIVNIEEWNIERTMPRTVLSPPAGGSPVPDVPNWAWHEYGNRVGFWRVLKVFDDFQIPACLAINGSAIDTYAPISRAAHERGWEFIGHGFTQQNMQKVADEPDDIRKTTEAIERFTGTRPRGWLGPGLTETWDTPEHLVDAGYDYVCDWVLDDQPVDLRTRNGQITNIPYTQECNDVAMMLIQHHPAREYRDRAIDQAEQLLEDAQGSARVMALVLHPYIMGAPHRCRYFRQVIEHLSRREGVTFTTGGALCDWHREHQEKSKAITRN